MWGELVSYMDELYIYGGWPTQVFIDSDGDRPWYGEKNQYMLKLDQTTCSWNPVSFKGAPESCWTKDNFDAKGEQSEHCRSTPMYADNKNFSIIACRTCTMPKLHLAGLLAHEQ